MTFPKRYEASASDMTAVFQAGFRVCDFADVCGVTDVCGHVVCACDRLVEKSASTAATLVTASVVRDGGAKKKHETQKKSTFTEVCVICQVGVFLEDNFQVH
jgi:hypothetical protein